MSTDVQRVVIADDEEIARRRMHRLLQGIASVEVVGTCKDGTEVLKRVAEGGIDVVLLDIQMPGLTGLEAMALLPEGGPYVIFCTAHAEHAVHAFDVGAVDYLLKPIEAERLAKALDRARSRDVRERFHREAKHHRATREGSGAAPLSRLAVPTKQGIVLLDPNEISHAILSEELVTLYVGASTYLTDDSLQSLEARLGGAFERVHRRALLNLDHVARLEPCPTGGYVARTRRGDAVEVSRQAARSLRRRLGLRKGPGDDDE
jgi:two-component system LytT family response regulator